MKEASSGGKGTRRDERVWKSTTDPEDEDRRGRQSSIYAHGVTAPCHVPETAADQGKNTIRYLLMKPQNDKKEPIHANGTPTTVDTTLSDDVAIWWKREQEICGAP